MKDTITLILIFAVAILAESEPWVLIPFVVAAILLQYDKIEKILKQ